MRPSHKATTRTSNTLFYQLATPLTITLILFLIAFKPASADDSCAPAPSVAITPQEVVKTVINALKTNDKQNNGIATVFCFASPSNKSSTGPLERFTTMITKGYGEMLNHAYSYVEDMKIKNDVAMQTAWLVTEDGREFGYLFTIGKQKDGVFANMWMTEAVMPLRRKGTQGIGI